MNSKASPPPAIAASSSSPACASTLDNPRRQSGSAAPSSAQSGGTTASPSDPRIVRLQVTTGRARPRHTIDLSALVVEEGIPFAKANGKAPGVSKWDPLLDNSSNVALIRAEKIDELAVECVLRAQAAIIGMKERYQRIGRFGADAAALQDVPPMLDFYCDLLSFSSPQIMTDALMESVQRMNQQRESA